MQKQQTIYHLVVDKSGSMSDCIENTIVGFNEQVAKITSLQREFSEQEICMGLTTFNNDVDHHVFGGQPEKIEKLTIRNYRPSGGTALYDAIGQSITGLQKILEVVRDGMDTSVVMVILTDGYENSSTQYNLAMIRKMISSLEASGAWTFRFIGATLDAVDVAESMAFKRSNSYSYEKQNMKADVWDKLSSSMNELLFEKRSIANKKNNTDK